MIQDMTSSSIFQIQTICLVQSENPSLNQMLRGFDSVPGQEQTVRDRSEASGIENPKTQSLESWAAGIWGEASGIDAGTEVIIC